jgi:hypothetical protein
MATNGKKTTGNIFPKRARESYGTYQGEELKPTPGIGPDRFEAFRLPSRIGNKRFYPDGRVLTVK